MKGQPVSQREVTALLVHNPQPALQYPPLVQIESRFLAVQRFRPRTVTTYADALKRFHRFLASVGVDPFVDSGEALPDDVLEFFCRWLKDERRPSRSTIEISVRGVAAFFRFGVRKRLLPPNFVYELMLEGLAEILGPHRSRSPRIDPRIARIVVHVDGLPLPPPDQWDGAARLTLLRDRVLLHVLFYSGMRRAEVASLNRQDLQDGWSSSALVVGKGDKERNVYFDDETLAHVRAYLEARADALEPVFLRHDNRRGGPGPRGEHWRLSPQSVWGIVKRYADAVGVHATPHHFRHLKASTLLNRGASLSEVQDVLGHADPSTTKAIYAHYTPQHLHAAVEKYSASPAELVAELETEQERRRAQP